jgi:hypothetical protein
MYLAARIPSTTCILRVSGAPAHGEIITDRRGVPLFCEWAGGCRQKARGQNRSDFPIWDLYYCGMEQGKGEGFVDWIHRRLDEGESDRDLKPSKPSNPLTPSEPSDGSTSSPGV